MTRKEMWRELVIALWLRDYIRAGVMRANIKDLTSHELELINWISDRRG